LFTGLKSREQPIDFESPSVGHGAGYIRWNHFRGQAFFHIIQALLR
jgi:hypothetical protein